jgi:hypothetical protein
MKISIILIPNGKKNLNDTIYDIIDTCVNGDVQKFGAKAAYWTSGIFGDNGNNALFSLLHSFFESLANSFLKDNNIPATVKNLVINKKGEELDVSIDLEDIDYKVSVTNNQERIIDALKNLSPENVAWDILGVLQGDTDTIVSSVLDTVNDEKKEKIIKLLINKFHPNICKALTGLLADNKIGLGVKNLSLV